VDPRGVDLGIVSFPEVLTLLLISATLYVASLHSRIYTAFASLLGSLHDLLAYRVDTGVFDTEPDHDFDNDRWED
jgi:hypothetical protein